MISFRQAINALVLIGTLVSFSACSDGAGVRGGNTPIEDYDPDGGKFQTLQNQYFEKLDFRVGASRLKTIPAFATKLNSLADGQRAKLASSPTISQSDQEHAGLVFIYDALMTMNINNGVEDGVFSISDLKSAHTFGSTGGTDRDELLARAEDATANLSSASKLRPGDRRIDSWLASAKIGEERALGGGPPSDKMLSSALDAIPSRPTFNLFTAILLFRIQDGTSPLFERLTGEAKKFADATSGGFDPCAAKPQDCQNGVHAPYNFQAALVIMGDVFLRRSEYFLKSGDIPHAMQMAGYAKGTYSQLDRPEHVQASKSWPDRVAMKVRQDHLAEIQQTHLPSPPLFGTGQYAQVYECASCHGRAK